MYYSSSFDGNFLILKHCFVFYDFLFLKKAANKFVTVIKLSWNMEGQYVVEDRDMEC